MYGKLMSISDELMWRYWTLLTDQRTAEIDATRHAVAAGTLHPMEVKKDLARTITSDFHGDQAALRAAEGWSRQFQQHGVSDDVPVVEIAADDEELLAGQGAGEAVHAAPAQAAGCGRPGRLRGGGKPQAGGECREREWRKDLGQAAGTRRSGRGGPCFVSASEPSR